MDFFPDYQVDFSPGNQKGENSLCIKLKHSAVRDDSIYDSVPRFAARSKISPQNEGQ